MKDSAIVWAARDQIYKGWCQGKSYDVDGNFCAIGAITSVCFGQSSKESNEIFPSNEIFLRICSSISRTLYERNLFYSIHGFNDDPHTTKQDVLDLFEKTAIKLEESGL